MKAILWDLDGTIINSEEGITKCVQYALRAHGIEEPDLKKLLCFIGPPLDPVFREKYGMLCVGIYSPSENDLRITF